MPDDDNDAGADDFDGGIMWRSIMTTKMMRMDDADRQWRMIILVKLMLPVSDHDAG